MESLDDILINEGKRKSLEDIVLTKTFTHKERIEGGKIKEVIRIKKIPLTVKSISQGLRFVHLVTDYLIMIIMQFVLQTFEPFTSLIILLMAPIYYSVMEYYFQQTPGKMITGTVVIDKYAQKPDFRICLLRTLIRMVPFHALSCLGTPSRGWHDKWTDTYVVKKEYAKELELLLEKHNGENN